MKRTLVLICILTFAGSISAQQPVDYLIKAKALKFKDYRFYTERGDVFIARGDLAGAKADFEAANSLLNLSGEYGLARISAMKGDVAVSLKHLENNINSAFKKGLIGPNTFIKNEYNASIKKASQVNGSR